MFYVLFYGIKGNVCLGIKVIYQDGNNTLGLSKTIKLATQNCQI